MKSVNQTEFFAVVQSGARVVDVRESYEYQNGHVPNAENIPMSELEKRFNEVNDGDYIICQSGVRSANCCAFLELKGIRSINVLGGTNDWEGVLEY